MNVATKAAINSPLRLWAIRLLVVGFTALAIGVGVHVIADLISSDPCLDDWDIECTSVAGERLDLAQGLMLPVIFLGHLSLVGSAVFGLVLLATSAIRQFESRLRRE